MSKPPRREYDERLPWWLFVFSAALVGSLIGGQAGAMYGGLIGFGLLLIWATWEHVMIERRKARAAAVEYEDEEADA